MRLILCIIYVLMGALFYAYPNITRRELLFAVPVPPGFRESPAGRHAIRMFRLAIVAAVLAGACALLLAPAGLANAMAGAMPIAISLAGAVAFWRQNRALAASAQQYTRPREAEMTSTPERLPWYGWLAAGPFAILAAAATWLYLNWDRIPERFPVHFDVSGQANRWATRTIKGVYGPLFFGAELCAFTLIMAVAAWFGARRSRTRPVMLGGMIAAEYLLGLLFALITLQAPLGIPVWVIALAPVAILIPLIIVMVRKMTEPWEPMDPTPNECWKADIFYYNPNDAALFVEKRAGLGFTLNFANRWCWVLLLCLVLVVVSARFVVA